MRKARHLRTDEFSNDEVPRRRARFRAWHRGTREMDLLLGRFADAHVTDMDQAELLRFEALMGLPDPDLYVWITASEPPPDGPFRPLLDRLRAFHRRDLS